MSALFHAYVYQPILAVLVFIYHNLSFGDLGIAIVLLTLFVRLVLFPIFYKGAKDQALMQRLQPKIKQIQTTHKENKEKQAQELMALYKEHKLNPLSGLLLLIVQLPVFIALFQIFRNEISTSVFNSQSFLGLLNLGEASVVITLCAAILQFFQARMLIPPAQPGGEKNPFASAGRMMIYIGPILTIVVLLNLPAALGLYWVVTTLVSIAQQAYINRSIAEKYRGT